MPQNAEIPAALQGLAALGATDGLEMRPVLLRVLADLFITRGEHTREERRQFEAVALGLIGKSDQQTLDIVAAKLSRFGATPEGVVERMLDLGGVPAGAFLRHSSQVPRERIMAVAREGCQADAIAVAERGDLDEALTRELIGREEIEITRALIANPLAPVPDDLVPALVAQGRCDAALGKALCGRYSDPALTAPLYLWASPARRAAIVLGVRRALLEAPIRRPPDFHEDLNATEIERAAIKRDRPLLGALVARALGASLAQAADIVGDARGEPMALVLASLRTPHEAAARIFMCLDPEIAHSHTRVRELSQMVALTPAEAARQILDAIVGKPQAPRVARPPVGRAAAETPSRPASNARPADVAQPTPTVVQKRPVLLFRRRA